MSVWTAPATFTAAATLTAAQLNAEVRDHLVYVKNVFDSLTNSSTSDTADTMYLGIERASTGLVAYQAAVTGEAQPRFSISSDGIVSWGTGGVALDCTLSRFGTHELQLNSQLGISYSAGTSRYFYSMQTGDAAARIALGLNTSNTPIIEWGDGAGARDVNLYRKQANMLATDDSFWIGPGAWAMSAGVYMSSTNGSVTSYCSVGGGGFGVVNSALNTVWNVSNAGVMQFQTNQANLYESPTFCLKSDSQLQAAGGLITKTKAGIPADGDFFSPTSGMIAVDTTNSRIYVRVGATWKYAALT